MPARVYTNKDANLRVLQHKTLAVIGYGSQGHAHALNLKESGLRVIVGLYAGSKSALPAVARRGPRSVGVDGWSWVWLRRAR